MATFPPTVRYTKAVRDRLLGQLQLLMDSVDYLMSNATSDEQYDKYQNRYDGLQDAYNALEGIED
jgi:hypothetical protein